MLYMQDFRRLFGKVGLSLKESQMEVVTNREEARVKGNNEKKCSEEARTANFLRLRRPPIHWSTICRDQGQHEHFPPVT